MRARSALAGFGVLAVLVAACSGVPTSSTPRVAQSIEPGGPPVQCASPAPRDETARQFVQAFLVANAEDPIGHECARQYLAASEQKVWSPVTTTIIIPGSVGNYDESSHKLTVTGQIVGTLTPQGIFAPPQANERANLNYGLSKNSQGAWRINSLPQTLVIFQDAFQSRFRQRVVYFYDVAGRYLVPDLRYSAISDTTQLAVWLMGQLAGQPRPDLSSVVSTNPFPTQQRHTTVSIGGLTKVQITGASQLKGTDRDHLAAVVARTLEPAIPLGGRLEILDGARAVTIPEVNGAVFIPADFDDEPGTSQPGTARELFYLRDGRIRQFNGALLPGRAGDRYRYRSVALARPDPAGGITVAGVVKAGKRAQLVVGSQSAGVAPTSIIGTALSRPAWAPGTFAAGSSEVWVGDGAKLLRVLVHGRTARVATVQSPSIAGGGQIRALRFSPDGSRIALVVAGAKGTEQLYIGAIVRSAGVPQVASVQLISPPGVVVQDVGWNYALALTAIGETSTSTDPTVFETAVDGSGWSQQNTDGLPGPPTSIAVTRDATSVAAEDSIWIQTGKTWVSAPGPTGQTSGTDPTYLE